MSAASLSGCAAAVTYRGVVADGRVVVPGEQVAQAVAAGGLLVEAPQLPEKIWLVPTAEGFVAVGAECTHLSCQVRPSGGFISCSCHGSTFHLDGRVIRGPAKEPLRRYAVNVVRAAAVAAGTTPDVNATEDVEILLP